MGRIPTGSSRGKRRFIVPLAALLFATPVFAQEVLLRIRPAAGDTLRMKMDQKFEMISDSVGREPSKPMSATVSVCTRSVVLSSSAQGSELESVTDSVTITPEAAAALPMFAQTRDALEGRKVRLRISPDGAITIVDGTKSAPGKDALSGQIPLHMPMPALLPKDPVSVGETWIRSLPVPLSATHSTQGLVRVTFRLDSLKQDGNLAYISMKGTFSNAAGTSAGMTDSTRGTLSGSMQIDRKRGWMTDSKATISMVSTMRPGKEAPPVRVQMKVTQWLRLVPPPDSTP